MARRKRRSWSVEEKRSICLQTLAPGLSVSQVARRYAMNANQIFNWLKDSRVAPSTDEIDTAVFLPIEVCAELTTNPLPCALDLDTACHSHGRVEIALSCGHRVIVEGGFDGSEIARLLKGLVS